MAERGSDQQRSAAQWRVLVGAYEASGLSVRAFCAQRGVAQSTFYQWLRRLREDAAGLGAAPLPGVQLVPVQVLQERLAPIAGGASGIAVVAHGGVRIEVACGFDGATLTRVLATLAARA
ncbi:hypothetical protein [uncultured Thiodictyon sp.]|uniref:IS66 family insertion sequence element accessory protein TnpA n=1 Tax=uncultured Thiodictyon sp. TaxID=1846217 RepID=UPI0025CBD90B|nr:hypothetical protein [uncultured Thiodictyon sp.]